jgi:hypothetical protein
MIDALERRCKARRDHDERWRDEPDAVGQFQIGEPPVEGTCDGADLRAAEFELDILGAILR